MPVKIPDDNIKGIHSSTSSHYHGETVTPSLRRQNFGLQTTVFRLLSSCRQASTVRPPPHGLCPIGPCHQASPLGVRYWRLYLSASRPSSLGLHRWVFAVGLLPVGLTRQPRPHNVRRRVFVVWSSSTGLRSMATACRPPPSASASRPPLLGLLHRVLVNGPLLHGLRLSSSPVGLHRTASACRPPPSASRPRPSDLHRRASATRPLFASLPHQPQPPDLRRRIFAIRPPPTDLPCRPPCAGLCLSASRPPPLDLRCWASAHRPLPTGLTRSTSTVKASPSSILTINSPSK